MSDTPTPSGSTPSPNQSEIDAALAAAGSPAEAGAPQAAAEAAVASESAVETHAVSAGETGATAASSAVAATADAVLADGASDAGGGVAVAPPPAAATKTESRAPEYDETAAAIAAALAEEQAQADAAAIAPPPGSMPLDLPDFGRRANPGEETRGVDLLNDVDLNVKIELGRAEMSIDEVLRLGAGAVVELNKLAGDPVDVLVNDRLVARGEVLILNDNFCVRISEILTGEEAEVTQ